MKTITLRVEDVDQVVIDDLEDAYYRNNQFDKVDCSDDVIEPSISDKGETEKKPLYGAFYDKVSNRHYRRRHYRFGNCLFSRQNWASW